MNLKEVQRVLQDMFDQELMYDRKRHLVFWYDQEGEFTEEIDRIDLDNVRKWEVTKNNLFATKYELEKNDPNSHFLLYTNMEKPSPREDWLYDLYKLGFEFATDKITIIMRELGISDDFLRHIFQSYKSFFNSKIRLQSFQRYTVEQYTEETIDLTILAALTKSRTNKLDDILKALFIGKVSEDDSVWENIQKYGSEKRFWSLIEKYYGYILPNQTINSLAIFIMITYAFNPQNTVETPKEWKKHISSRPNNVIVFINQWMNHLEDRESYNQLASTVARSLKFVDVAHKWEITDVVHMDAFKLFDESIINYLADQLNNDLTQFDIYFEMISIRRRLHWYEEYKHEYEALHQAMQLIKRAHEINQFIPEESAYDMFEAYTKKYFLIDSAYRKFYVSYDRIEVKDRLHLIRKKIESLYSNWYIEELAMKWAGSLESAGNLTWPLPGVNQQKDFYQNWVHPYTINDERVFVIVSDGLRYDIAMDLMEELNNERKASTEMTATQSVLPSYTSLGMASLLPYKQMEYTATGQIKIDGFNTSGTKNRNKVIKNVSNNGLAIQFTDIAMMNRETFRKTFSGRKVIYIYHDTIDAHGDNQATENDVLHAAEEAITDIRTLVNKLINNVSASNIIITADHGFIYQRDPISNSQKIPQHSGEALVTNRRFVLSKQAIEAEGTQTYAMNYILNQDKELYTTVPKGANRFAVQGAGANYVHGGAMLQEIVVPVITFKNDRSKSSINQVKIVDVKLTSSIRKITDTITNIQLFQTSRIEDKVLPLKLKMYFVDDNGEHISNENQMIAESSSDQPARRVFKKRFIFKAIPYDRRKTYYLILENLSKNDGTIYERYPFTIDIPNLRK